MDNLKLYSIDFEPEWPVPCGLIIVAKSNKQAMKLAKETIKHTHPIKATLMKIDETGVVFYESGNY